ncbi:NAD(P)/FAD-dependent oxidoreductase [Parasalinivibrio latis]|uniref:NAD(P)/FAD-dependent oxidoreductase n=1 Tax=Parasalinivibrio latis TaxID=2952610 RepID=UPI0030E4569C
MRPDVDVAIIGAGVVGCAVTRALTQLGLQTALIEKSGDILEGASKGNSAILHTGFDAPAGSIELDCVRRGYALYEQLHRSFNLPLLRSGALVVAWDETQEAQLQDILTKAHNNGSTDTEIIGREKLFAMEPHLSKKARAAVHVPGESLIDPWSAPLAYLRHAMLNGAKLVLNSEVLGAHFDGKQWSLKLPDQSLTASIVVNTAGLFGDRVEGFNRPSPFEIHPRKGQFVVFDKAASSLANAILLPVPTPVTKGVVVCRTVFGNLLVGPTADEQFSRTDASVHKTTLDTLIDEGDRIIPGLKNYGVSACYAGIRPATQYKDYQLEAVPERNWITVGGIRSTGLTAALGIGEKVAEIYREHFEDRENGIPFFNPVAESDACVPNLCEYKKRPWQARHNGIVCHCEMVTRKEIEEALSKEPAAKTPGGLKRRTRAMMGRCQGFYCSWKVAEITEGKLSPSLSAMPDGTAKEGKSS